MSRICGGWGVRIWPITTTTGPTSDWRRRRPRVGRPKHARPARAKFWPCSGRRSAPSVHVVSSSLIIVETTSGAAPRPINRRADCIISRWEAAQEPIENSPAVGIGLRKCRTGMHAVATERAEREFLFFDDPQRSSTNSKTDSALQLICEAKTGEKSGLAPVLVKMSLIRMQNDKPRSVRLSSWVSQSARFHGFFAPGNPVHTVLAPARLHGHPVFHALQLKGVGVALQVQIAGPGQAESDGRGFTRLLKASGFPDHLRDGVA